MNVERSFHLTDLLIGKCNEDCVIMKGSDTRDPSFKVDWGKHIIAHHFCK